MKTKLCLVICLLIIAMANGLQSQTINALIGEKKVPIKVVSVNVDVKVLGNVATTTMDIVFRNDSSRTLEGELNFPLAAGQSVTRFAMDVNGKMREGVVVEKEKGRSTFESIVRRGVDPGLLEMTKGNNFKARVYPLLANKTKRIIIAYEEVLSSDDAVQTYRLPLNFPDQLEEFKLKATVYSKFKSPSISGDYSKDLDFDKDEDAWIATTTRTDYKAQSQFEFTVPLDNSAPQIFTEEFKGKTYFNISFIPNLPAKAKSMPKTLCLYFDVSSSRASANITKELELLGEYLKKAGNCQVTLFKFANKQLPPVEYLISNGNSDKLIADLKKQRFDGGTSLGNIKIEKGRFDEIWICSDGIGNFGAKEIKDLHTPIYCINSNQSAEHNLMQAISETSGGAYINLMQYDTEKALNMLINQVPKILGVEYDKNSIEEVNNYNKLKLNEWNSISGVLKSGSAKIGVRYGYDKKTSKYKDFTLKVNDNVVGGVIPRLWAQQRLAVLSCAQNKDKKAMTQLGTDYGIVTENTSLIVLETAWDYVRYGIEAPPDVEGYAELKMRQDSLKSRYSGYFRYNESRMVSDELKYWLGIPLSTNKISPVIQVKPKNGSSSYGTLKGKVSDEEGKPIVGATILLAGTKRGTKTIADGQYSIENISRNYFTIIARAKGMQEQRIRLELLNNHFTNLDFTLSPSVDTTVTVEERHYIEHSSEGSTSNITSDQITASGTDINGVIGNSPNEGGFMVRGSRETATQMRIDGVDIRNPLVEGSVMSGSNTNSQNFGVETVTVRTGGSANAGINLKTKEYDKNALYIKIINDAGKVGFEDAYFAAKDSFGLNPGFYLDVAEYAYQNVGKEIAIRILTNLAELKIEESSLLRVMAHKLEQFGQLEDAEIAFEDVLKIRGEEPQSYRDLALVRERLGKYQSAADLMYHVLDTNWDGRFAGIYSPAIVEFNHILKTAKGEVDVSKFNKDYIYDLSVPLRIVTNWDADNTDMDLHITEPDGVRCNYTNKITNSGGRLAYDMTGGYGPEEYMNKSGKKGKYGIKIHYYGSRSQKVIGAPSVKVTVFTNYGSDNEVRKDIIIKAKREEQFIEVGEVELK